jgi:hypothetical protein
MRRLFLTLAIILITLSCYAGSPLTVTLTGTGTTSCTSSTDSVLYSNITETTDAWVDRGYWWAQKVVITGNITLTCYSTKYNDTNVYDNNTEYVELWTHTAGPGAVIANTTSPALPESSITDNTSAEYELCLAAPINIDAGTYWVVFKATGTDTSTNKMRYNSSGAVGAALSNNQGTNWAYGVPYSGYDMYFKLSGCNR